MKISVISSLLCCIYPKQGLKLKRTLDDMKNVQVTGLHSVRGPLVCFQILIDTYQCFGHLTDIKSRELQMVLVGYPLFVMSLLDLIGFWHASERPKSARSLLEIYYKSVGRNCKLLLNVPPNSSGLISTEDIQVLREFSELRSSIFSHSYAASASINASSTRGGIQESRFSPYNVLEEGINTYWAPEENKSTWILYINFQEQVSFNVLQLQEPIHMGQRVIEFYLEALNRDGVWKRVINGTTIGYQRLLMFPKLKSQQLKLVVSKSREDPLISYLGIYMDPVTGLSEDTPYQKSVASFNGSQVNDSQSATF